MYANTDQHNTIRNILATVFHIKKKLINIGKINLNLFSILLRYCTLINFRDTLTSFNGYYMIPSAKYEYVVMAIYKRCVGSMTI